MHPRQQERLNRRSLLRIKQLVEEKHAKQERQEARELERQDREAERQRKREEKEQERQRRRDERETPPPDDLREL